MARRRAGSATVLVDEDNTVLNLPTASPPGLPSENVSTVQGTPNAYPVDVVGKSAVVPFQMVVDTAEVVDEDVMSTATQEIKNFFRVPGGTAFLHSLTVLDVADTGIAFDIYLLTAELSLGTANGALAITDQAARSLVNGGGLISITSSDLIDIGGARLATIKNIGLLLQAAPNSRSLFISSVSQGTATYASGIIRLGFGIARD
jgi:hypothetical protein